MLKQDRSKKFGNKTPKVKFEDVVRGGRALGLDSD